MLQKRPNIFLNDKFIIILILLNAILLFMQEFSNVPRWLEYVDSIFTLLFLVELIVKVKTWGWKGYLANGWNRFDCALVLISLPSLVEIFTPDSMYSLNFLLSLRALRVFKFFRLIRFFPNVDVLVAGVQRALKASYIVLLGFFTLVFIMAILTCSLYKDVAPEYFGSPVEAMYSVFRVFSIEGWYEIPDLIAERSGAGAAFFAKLYFVLVLFVGGIIGLSLVNSIFVDAMVSDNNDDLIVRVKELEAKIDKLTDKIDQAADKS